MEERRLTASSTHSMCSAALIGGMVGVAVPQIGSKRFPADSALPRTALQHSRIKVFHPIRLQAMPARIATAVRARRSSRGLCDGSHGQRDAAASFRPRGVLAEFAGQTDGRT